MLDDLFWLTTRLLPRAPEAPWLAVPTADGPIGPQWPDRWSAFVGSSILVDADGGLIPDVSRLTGSERIAPAVREFYEHTARFDLRLSASWTLGTAWLGGLWASLFARRWGQLELPLDPDQPLSNEILVSGEPDPCRWWVRRYPDQRVLYVSRYEVVDVDGEAHIRITFPVPRGAWVVLFRVRILDDGGLLLTEEGGAPGGPGLYLLELDRPARYLGAHREEIRVSPQPGGAVATHRMWFFGIPFLTLSYSLDSRGTA